MVSEQIKCGLWCDPVQPPPLYEFPKNYNMLQVFVFLSFSLGKRLRQQRAELEMVESEHTFH